MAFSRRLGIIGLLGASWLVAVACSDGDAKKTVAASDGGDGGEGPSGGKPTSGGSATNAGKAGTGTAGKGGTSNGGTSTGGNGGMSGGGTTAVGGENPGGAGGASAGAGGGSAAGDGGAGGVPAAVAQSCGNVCEIDADCAINNVVGQKCGASSHRCYDSTVITCQTNDDCAPSASFWTVTCTSDADCADDNTESCVASGGVGYCALLSVGDACDLGQPKDLPRVGAAGVSNVCVGYDTCQSGACNYNCADPLFGGFCGAGNGDTCNPNSGLCECSPLTDECTSGVCGANGQCAQCATNEDCAGAGALSGWDVCVNGKCGCSAAGVCPDQTAAATPICE